MLYTFLFLVGSLHAANAASQNCAPQYAFIAEFLDDYDPANKYCISRFGAPTSTVTVTSTSTRFQKRAEATLEVEIHAVDDKPKPGSPLAIANAEALLRRPSSANERRQGWFSFNPISNFNQMTKNPSAQAWVQAICSCIVDPVTKTTTAVVTRTIKTSTSTSTPTPTPSSIWKSSAISVPSVPAVPSSSSIWKSSALSIPSPSSSSSSSTPSVAIPTSSSSLWKSATLSTFSTSVRSSAAAPSLPSSAPAGPPSNGPSGNNPLPPASSVVQSLTSAANSVASSVASSAAQSLTSAANSAVSSAAQPLTSAVTSATQSLASAASSASAALPTTVPLSPAVQASNCATGAYNGTGACACAYTVFCGFSGSCGAANETAVTAAASWQACGRICDNDSACAAWSYSYATGLCTEVVDQDCTSDVFDTTADPNSVLGVYEGGCQGVCLT